MTEKEKAEAYDEAIERAKKLYGNGIAEEIFTELKESKDKKIREAILKGLIDCRDAPDLGWSNFGGIHIDNCIDWLEKQGKKSTAKIEPKFKVGDWITFHGGNSFKILKIEAEINGVLDYLLLDQNGYDSYFNKTYVDVNARLWTIQDAKDGDVIFYDEGWICIFKCIHGIWYSSYCFITDDGEFHTGYETHAVDSTIHGNAHPATKEQRDILMKAMNDAGYKWEDEKLTEVKLTIK